MLPAVIVGYLLGAIPVGIIVGRLAGRVDLRDHGSRRTGTTNALRVLGPVPAGIVLLLDVAKGAAAVLIGGWLAGGQSELAAAAAGVAAIVGHTWSVFIGFGGGRGVATAGGALLAMAPLLMLVVVPIMLLVVWITKYVSLGSLTGALLAPVVAVGLALVDLAPSASVALAAGAGVLIVLRHADNIDRLRHGTERRLGQREPAGRP
ncbi:MAG: glycerol-3-phosphate 1-O-acyltransferase PlsY [Chloroflexota bacterium]|nr:glycerol-3-phosphate 1-O-acyltransferase PlsY [Chloroflexota bacterium]